MALALVKGSARESVLEMALDAGLESALATVSALASGSELEMALHAGLEMALALALARERASLWDSR